MITRLRRDEAGSSILEIGVSLLITALMTVTMVTWMNSAGAAAALHHEDDAVVQDLRLAKERISRELRVAEAVYVATPTRVTVWVDDDDDDFADAGEKVTWYIGEDGRLWRWTDVDDEQIQVSNLVFGESWFGYDNPDAGLVQTITVTLVARVQADEDSEPSERQISTQIHLRNR